MSEFLKPLQLEEKPLERVIELLPATDARAMGGGQSSVTIRFFVRGEKGAISVYFHTMWYLDEEDSEVCCGLGSWDYHSYTRTDDSETAISECKLLHNKPCFCGGSSLRAMEFYWPLLLKEGSEGLLDQLEKDYFEVFYSTKETKDA